VEGLGYVKPGGDAVVTAYGGREERSGLTTVDAGVSFSLMDRTHIVHSDPDILGGTPVFVGTRVPVQTLLVYIESGETIEEFLDNFPTVSKAQAVAFLEEAGRALLADIA
jgi:uncharacterized protein (DUF433 family)